MRRPLLFALLCLAFSVSGAAQMVSPQESRSAIVNAEITRLEAKVRELESRVGNGGAVGAAALVSAALCALWAQNSRRSAWLWFIVGLCCMPIALIVMLVKNSNDRFERRTFGRTELDQPPPS